MGFARASIAVTAFVTIAGAAPRVARGGKHDLRLVNLCPNSTRQQYQCDWIDRDQAGRITGVTVGEEGRTAFRSLMSELGVVVAPRLQTPADTLGFAGFQFSAELGFTKISNQASYWDGVQGVDPLNPSAARPDGYLATVGGFVRKGLWFPIPGLEYGAGAINVVGSGMVALQGYAKLALHEGFHDWPLPSVAARGAASHLTGTAEVDLTVWSVDVLISKAFTIGKTVRFEPYGGWNRLYIDARSGVIDATPACDAYALSQMQGGTAPAGCVGAQPGATDDLNATFSFARQDAIVRDRFFAGVKLRLSVLFLVGQYEITPGGRSRDQRQAEGARDTSGQQQGLSLSAGFDF